MNLQKNSRSPMFRKVLSVVLSAALCLSLAACGSQKTTEESTTSNTATVTFPEGTTVMTAAAKLEKAGVCSAEDFETACSTVPEGYSRLLDGVSADGRVFALEGYIFPDTYEFYKNEDAATVVKTFLDTLNTKITDEDIARAKKLGLSLEQVFTLASIIQAEAGEADQMKKVSSVFHNRLDNTASFPYLGSDVTRQYIESKTMKAYITSAGLDYDTLFGNYCTNDNYDHKTKGLPIGPVCNPGYDAIEAALYPADDDYTYFFTDPSGNYHYFKTLSAFQTAWNAIQATATTTKAS